VMENYNCAAIFLLSSDGPFRIRRVELIAWPSGIESLELPLTLPMCEAVHAGWIARRIRAVEAHCAAHHTTDVFVHESDVADIASFRRSHPAVTSDNVEPPCRVSRPQPTLSHSRNRQQFIGKARANGESDRTTFACGKASRTAKPTRSSYLRARATARHNEAGSNMLTSPSVLEPT
jgi:hypothetical protein